VLLIEAVRDCELLKPATHGGNGCQAAPGILAVDVDPLGFCVVASINPGLRMTTIGRV
jgi:hypothetical protein